MILGWSDLMRSSSTSTKLARRLAFALAALIFAAAPAQALPRKLPPVEQCGADASFAKFRSALKRTVERKDRDALLAMLAPDVLVNFGGATGREAFAKDWSFDPSEYGNIWDQLETMLKMGCEEEEGAKIIPSLIIQLGPYPEEAVADAVLVLPGAKLYKEVGVESANPRTTAWSVAKVTSRAADWGTGVRLPDGREGFIPDDEVYEPVGYRMVIEQDDAGKWMITAFVAGD